ncbi:MAG: LysM peptidoglycan-binding domain-containing M23 family metallopeptidase [Aestuariivita sp.]|nr:LysM peptidoglycan-binding domain-containing M23 family metallopeptidase [Aestuariivita sp.]
MTFTKLRIFILITPLTLISCSEISEVDLRGNFGGFTTSEVATTLIQERPFPDDRGLITYPNFQFAVARRADTIETIARRLGVDPQELADFNKIDLNTSLHSGELIALPYRINIRGVKSSTQVDLATLANNALEGIPNSKVINNDSTSARRLPTGDQPIRHRVLIGETAYTIARLYNVPVQSLADWNGLDSDYKIREGQYLLIPTTTQSNSSGTITETVLPNATTPGIGTPTPTPPSATRPLPKENAIVAKPTTKNTEINIGTPSTSSAKMVMPLDGKIIRDYQKGKNDGIDIAGPPGNEIKAASGGTVAAVTSSADRAPIVILRHPDNVITVYANVGEISVQRGDTVSRGQTIARLKTESNTFLHFEIREGVEAVDPFDYLR